MPLLSSSVPAAHHQRPWWRRRAAAFAVALLAAALFLTLSRYAFPSTSTNSSPSPSYGHRLPTLVDLTLVDGAKDKGAVCLDGTPPGYHWLPGFGEGSDKWLIHLEGGSWCRNLASCAQRKKTNLGSSAYMAFLTGCSAGGLSTYIHCDDFRALLPKASTVKCLADGGFFLDAEDISGRRYMRGFYNDVARLQDLRKRFSHCSSDMEPGQCFFPREVAKGITTPMFILNPAYDVWQVEHVLSPEGSDPQRLWQNCRLDITKCDSKQLEILQGFRKELLDAVSEFKKRRDWGMFIDSCFIHCQSMNPLTWHSPSASRINNKTIAEAVGDWFFDRREVKEIDCEYPCNPTCYNAVLDRPYKED